MDSKKVKQAFKESILFREQAFKRFESALNRTSFAEASKILQSFKVSTLGKLKEQVMDGEVKVDELDKATEQMDSEPEMTESGDGTSSSIADSTADAAAKNDTKPAKDSNIADAPAEAEEGSTSDPSPKSAEERNRETMDADELMGDKPMAESEDSDGEVTLKDVMNKMESMDQRLIKMEETMNSDGSDDKPMSETEDEEEPAKDPMSESDDEEESDEMSESDDLSDEELPEPPAMAEQAEEGEEDETNSEQMEDDEETHKEAFRKKANVSNLFK